MDTIYEVYCPGHYSTRRALPYFKNGEIMYPPATHQWIPEKSIKLFKDEMECLKYCVKHGYQYREIEVY